MEHRDGGDWRRSGETDEEDEGARAVLCGMRPVSEHPGPTVGQRAAIACKMGILTCRSSPGQDSAAGPMQRSQRACLGAPDDAASVDQCSRASKPQGRGGRRALPYPSHRRGGSGCWAPVDFAYPGEGEVHRQALEREG